MVVDSAPDTGGATLASTDETEIAISRLEIAISARKQTLVSQCKPGHWLPGPRLQSPDGARALGLVSRCPSSHARCQRHALICTHWVHLSMRSNKATRAPHGQMHSTPTAPSPTQSDKHNTHQCVRAEGATAVARAPLRAHGRRGTTDRATRDERLSSSRLRRTPPPSQ